MDIVDPAGSVAGVSGVSGTSTLSHGERQYNAASGANATSATSSARASWVAPLTAPTGGCSRPQHAGLQTVTGNLSDIPQRHDRSTRFRVTLGSGQPQCANKGVDAFQRNRRDEA
jgi:hypothetical protein